MISLRSYRRLMTQYQKTGTIRAAADAADIDRGTAAHYIHRGFGPQPEPRRGRRRPDPLVPIWAQAERFLEESPELEAKALFEYLQPDASSPVQAKALRTFQRRVRDWRRLHGPPREIFFPQVREPAREMQFDWTHVAELAVTIAGKPAPEKLFHAVLPYSNAEWAQPCHSESFLSLAEGVAPAFAALGGVPPQVRSDHSSTATHQISRTSGKRTLNAEYLDLCRHYGVEPSTIQVACPHENGDIESAHRHLKRRLANHLALRGSRDFADEAAWAAFVAAVCTAANGLRKERWEQERAKLRPLPPQPFPAVRRGPARVGSHSTVRVAGCAYSVPSRWIGSTLEAEVGESYVRLRHGRDLVLEAPREPGRTACIDFRHLLPSLRRKPGAFEGYVHREELFPTVTYRQAWDRFGQECATPAARAEAYLDLLLLAADHGVAPIGQAVAGLLREDTVPWAADVARLLARPAEPPRLEVLEPVLSGYDALLGRGEVSA